MTLYIRVRTIPHDKQRVDKQIGDWLGDWPGHAEILVSELPDWRHEFLIGLHEMVEQGLCQHRGIREADVTEFDEGYAGDGEPGAEPRAPYHREHMFATKIEELVAAELGVVWEEYETAIAQLGEG